MVCRGLSRKRSLALFEKPDRHHFLFGRGMVSDDSEHTCAVAQSLIVSGGNIGLFQRSLAWRFRFWILGLPVGIGLATLRSIFKLWIGFSADNSGVYSAGNGPAMRTAIIGIALEDTNNLVDFVRASTKLTHTDPKAEYGVLAVALAASMARKGIVSGSEYLIQLEQLLNTREGAGEFTSLIRDTINSINSRGPTLDFAASQGLQKGVSGYVYHTVPIALHAWLSHPDDFKASIITAIECGGDTDTVAAIVGGIAGAYVGKEGIPVEWLERLWEWPRTTKWMEALAKQLYECTKGGYSQRPMKLSFCFILLRNIFFLMVVLLHGFRRQFPPY